MKRHIIKRLLAAVLCATVAVQIPVNAAESLAERLDYKDYEDFSDIAFNNNYYGDYIKHYSDSYTAAGEKIIIGAEDFKPKGKSPELRSDSENGKGIYWTADTESLSYTLDIKTEGLYNVCFKYYPEGGNSLNISRGIKIDGEYPFDEASGIVLSRRFTDENKPKLNNLGDELMPQQKEVKCLLSSFAWDSQGAYSTPLEFYFTKGKHTLSFDFIDQPVLLYEIAVTGAERRVSYKELSSGYSENNGDGTLRFQAEDIESVWGKSSFSILIGADSDETLTPKSTVTKKLNYLNTCAASGDSVTWKFKIDEPGLYKIALRSVQNGNSGIPVYRTIEIDGEIPFAEAAGYEFPYNSRWNTHVIGGEDNPYLFELSKGEHTLKITAVTGDKTQIIQNIEKANSKLQACYQNIVMVTGQSPDLNYDYELDKSIQGLGASLKEISDILNDCMTSLDKISNKTSTVRNSIEQVKATIDSYKDDFDAIPGGLADFTSSMTSMGDWLTTLKASSLAVDYVEIASPDIKLDNPKQSIFNRIVNAVRNLVLSYTKDYNAIGSVGEGGGSDAKELNVWISRSKEWAEILKELADSDFAAENNVRLKFNLLPEGAFSGTVNTLLLSVNAGKVPDVVLNMSAANTTEYAVRGVIKDLAEFEDFEEYRGYTLKELYNPIAYGKSVYALPESVTFTVMFYRTDMFERLHMQVPDTWDDVYNVLLPKLNQYKLNMYIPQTFELFMYQYGAEYYSKDGKTSALSSEASYNAFERFIKNYTEYGFPYNVSFYNRFRTGEMIIGIGSMADYMSIAYAAPELTGKWAIAPVPATVMSDGTLNRSVPSALSTVSVIMENAKNPEDAWKFLKWWMSADTQSEYASRLESRMGISSRWGSANSEAFNLLAWSAEDLKVIKTSLENVKEAPYVPGGYFTSRHITNAISRCLTGGYTPRDSMEEAVEQINIELERKRKDLGIEDGKNEN